MLGRNGRHPSMMQTVQQSPFGQQQPVRGSYKTEQNFYRQGQGSGGRQEQQQYPPHPMAGNYGQEHRNSQSQLNQFGGGMGVMNYNAFNQKEYD